MRQAIVALAILVAGCSGPWSGAGPPPEHPGQRFLEPRDAPYLPGAGRGMEVSAYGILEDAWTVEVLLTAQRGSTLVVKEHHIAPWDDLQDDAELARLDMRGEGPHKVVLGALTPRQAEVTVTLLDEGVRVSETAFEVRWNATHRHRELRWPDPRDYWFPFSQPIDLSTPWIGLDDGVSKVRVRVHGDAFIDVNFTIESRLGPGVVDVVAIPGQYGWRVKGESRGPSDAQFAPPRVALGPAPAQVGVRFAQWMGAPPDLSIWLAIVYGLSSQQGAQSRLACIALDTPSPLGGKFSLAVQEDAFATHCGPHWGRFKATIDAHLDGAELVVQARGVAPEDVDVLSLDVWPPTDPAQGKSALGSTYALYLKQADPFSLEVRVPVAEVDGLAEVSISGPKHWIGGQWYVDLRDGAPHVTGGVRFYSDFYEAEYDGPIPYPTDARPHASSGGCTQSREGPLRHLDPNGRVGGRLSFEVCVNATVEVTPQGIVAVRLQVAEPFPLNLTASLARHGEWARPEDAKGGHASPGAPWTAEWTLPAGQGQWWLTVESTGPRHYGGARLAVYSVETESEAFALVEDNPWNAQGPEDPWMYAAGRLLYATSPNPAELDGGGHRLHFVSLHGDTAGQAWLTVQAYDSEPLTVHARQLDSETKAFHLREQGPKHASGDFVVSFEAQGNRASGLAAFEITSIDAAGTTARQCLWVDVELDVHVLRYQTYELGCP